MLQVRQVTSNIGSIDVPSIIIEEAHTASMLSVSKQNMTQWEDDDLTTDIQNSRVKELLLGHGKVAELMDRTRARQHQEQVKDNQVYIKQWEERKWLIKKGRKYLIDFDNDERKEMRRYFNSLDEKKTGSIGIEELEQLLLSVGLFETREQIKALIDSVDQDRSGKIEFGQFLSMILNDEGQNQDIVSFFKTVIGGKLKDKPVKRIPNRSINTAKSHSQMPRSCVEQILQKHPYPKGLSFEMVVSHIRRKHMMTGLNIGRGKQGEAGSHKLLPSNMVNGASMLGNGDNTVAQVAKGQRVMNSLQKMYERKLIRQIKEQKRQSNQLRITKRASATASVLKRVSSSIQGWLPGGNKTL